MKKMLILGASGLVGKAIAQKCNHEFDVYGTYYTSTTNLHPTKQFQLNIQDLETLNSILATVNPDIVVSCLTGDFQQLLTFHHLLATKLANKSLLYYFSTANVFDGDLRNHHNEQHTPIAQSEYGQFKINCEQMLLDLLKDRVIILRIPAIWGKNSPRLNTLLKNVQNKKPIQAYRNLQCSFLTDVHLAKQLHFIMKNQIDGIIHLSSEDTCTEAQFYEALLQKLAYTDIPIHDLYYDDRKNLYFFGLHSIRHEFPNTFSIKTDEIISYLASNPVKQP